MSKPTPYHRMSIVEKRNKALATAREPSVTCPQCDTQVMPVDLLAHLRERCSGPRDPGPGAQWLTWGEALEMLKLANIPPVAMSRWVNRLEIRFRGERGDRLYLLRDLVLKVAAQIVRSRR
jgi:hypothetical protein